MDGVIVGVCVYGSMTVWEYVCMGVCAYGSMCVWEYDSMNVCSPYIVSM